jgi:hypothetical protein
MPRIRKPKPRNKGDKVGAAQVINYDDLPPLFSLARIQNSDYCFTRLDQEHKAAFAEAVYRRRNCTWKQLKQAPRHGLGLEKIAKTSIRSGVPAFITPDQDHFLAFRYNGYAAMVGYRLKDVFYVLWFDHDFSLYPHE